MNHHYSDIRSRIPEPPRWWDENAVPRYCDFAPGEVANIYAEECALVRIACQACGKTFDVCISSEPMWKIGAALTLAESIEVNALSYGDPPNTQCCPAGPTMSSDTVRVLQYWRRTALDWTRDQSFEVDVSDDE